MNVADIVNKSHDIADNAYLVRSTYHCHTDLGLIGNGVNRM